MVEYFTIELLPGVQHFRCSALSASLSVKSCANMWKQANAGAVGNDRLFRCRGCSTGAEHAGEANASLHRLRLSSVCSRCHRSDMRLIGGNLCVSCQNRQYECVKGRNSKGQKPVMHPPLNRRAVKCLVGGKVKVVSRPLTVSSLELVVEVLRDEGQKAFFGLGVNRG